ncbi:MAG: hypothetical protein P4M11_04125 [Candidatus Pacebacteria bacterium]|nr:hypothetical protein [Candidatus Paceibacterota bacterium]
MDRCAFLCSICTRVTSVMMAVFKSSQVLVSLLLCGLILLCLAHYMSKCGSLSLYYAPTETNDYIVRRVPSFSKVYRPTFYLSAGLLQTLCYGVCRKMAKIDCGVRYDRQLVKLPDGGQVSLDWAVAKRVEISFTESTPIVVLLPGTTGGRHDTYIAATISEATRRGYKSVLLNQRGLSHTPLTVRFSPRFSSSRSRPDWRPRTPLTTLMKPSSQ